MITGGYICETSIPVIKKCLKELEFNPSIKEKFEHFKNLIQNSLNN